MKFDVDKLKKIARPMTEAERREIEEREENRDWLALSAKFALLVRQILRTEKITQKELARRMKVSCSQVTKILSGKENLSFQTISKVEHALGSSLIRFCDFESPSQILTPVKEYPIVAYDTIECSAYFASDSMDSTYSLK